MANRESSIGRRSFVLGLSTSFILLPTQVSAMKSLVINRSLKYCPKGTSFVTAGGVAQYINDTAAMFTHGPGTGGSCAGTATVETSVPSDLIGDRNFLRVNWTGAPTNAEGRQPYPTYFSNCWTHPPGASALAGKEVMLIGRLRTNFSASVTVIPFYSDGLGTSGAERFIFGNRVTVPTGNSWIDVAQSFRPQAAAIVPTTIIGDNLSCGFGIETSIFSGLTLPGRIDYSFDVVDPNQASWAPSVEDDFDRASAHIRLMGRGSSGYAINATSVRMGFVFGGRPMVGAPGIYLQGTPVVWQAGATFSAGAPSILAANVVNQYGAQVDIGGFSGLTAGAPVVGAGDFLLADAG